MIGLGSSTMRYSRRRSRRTAHLEAAHSGCQDRSEMSAVQVVQDRLTPAHRLAATGHARVKTATSRKPVIPRTPRLAPVERTRTQHRMRVHCVRAMGLSSTPCPGSVVPSREFTGGSSIDLHPLPDTFS